MTERLDLHTLAARSELVAPPVAAPAVKPDQRACEDRTFELPRALHIGTAALFLAYMAIMAVGFRNNELVLPMVINFIFISAAFGVPALWATMKPDNPSQALGLDGFMANGVDCLTGRLDGRSASVQVLIMPVLVLLWGIGVVTIAAMV